jgi:glycosyltransferase involved in cell wall biosynthesis
MKVLFLTPSQSEQCGIWTYTKYLMKRLDGKLDKVRMTRSFDEFNEKLRYFDLVHLQDEYGIVPDALLHFLRDEKIPYVVTMHTIWSQRREHHDALTAKNCKAIILHSEDQKKALLKTHAGLESKVHIIPHGSFETEVDEHKAPCNTVKFGAFGFSSYPKRFVETFQQLEKTNLDFEYRLLSSYQEDNYQAIAYANHLVTAKVNEDRMAEREGRKTRFYLHNEFLPEETILEKLKQCDILLSFVTTIAAPSVSGSSRFLMQAGRPVIVTDIYHYSDVPNDVFVKIHPSLDPREIEWAVDQVLSDYDGYIQRIAEFTKQTSWERVAEQHISIYKGV